MSNQPEQCPRHPFVMQAMESNMEWVKSALETQAGSLEKIHTILSGNGKLGLVSRVQILWHTYVSVVGILGTIAGSLATIIGFKMFG